MNGRDRRSGRSDPGCGLNMSTLVRILFLTLLAVGTLAAAGDPSPAPGQAEPTPTPKASQTPSPTPSADAEELLEEFVPSEEVRADQAVAFPVDI